MTVNIHKFYEQYLKEYDFLYNARDYVAGMREAVVEFDNLIENSKRFRDFVVEFNSYRENRTGFFDIISSDREAAAFMFALDDLS